VREFYLKNLPKEEVYRHEIWKRMTQPTTMVRLMMLWMLVNNLMTALETNTLYRTKAVCGRHKCIDI
jgi:hypothetical protein